MYGRLLILLLVAYCDGNETDVGIYELYEEPSPIFRQLARIIMYAFKSHRCVQITTDESPFAFEMMEQIYKATSTWTYINGVNLKLKTCNGYILIAKRLRIVKTLLKRIPLYYENRILCIVGKGWHKNLYNFIMNPQDIFKDSEALVSVLGTHPVLYKRTQPFDTMERLVFPVGEWKTPEWGVQDFLGKEIVVGTFNCSIFTQLGPQDDENIVAVKGVDVKILLEIFQRLNLKYKIKVPNDADRYGKLINGKWTGGLMKMITNRQVDMVNCGIWHTHSMTDLDMSFPLGQVCLKMIVPRPKLLSTQWYDIFRPFSYYLWSLLATMVLFLAFVLNIFKIITSMNDRKRKHYSYLQCVVQVFSIFLQSGVLKTQKGALGQLVLWLVVFSMVLSSGYSGGLISNLFKPRYERKIEAIPELIARDFHWTESVIPDVEVIFNSDDKWQKEWVRRLRVIPTKEGLENVLKSKKFVKYGTEYEGGFFFEEDYNLKIFEEYEAASYCYKKFFIAFVYRKGSPYIKPFRKYIHRFHNGGIIIKLAKDAVRELIFKNPYTVKFLHSSKSEIKESQKLKINIHQLKGIFVIWICGIFLSTIVFGIEKYYFKYHTKREKISIK